MHNLKISVITVAFNAQNTITECLNSVTGQKFSNLEHIVIDGGSADSTVRIIKESSKNRLLVSEPDQGIYDAMNKGIKMASGDIIGMLNADDYFADDEVLRDIAAAFADPNVSILYGDLDYVDLNGRIVRKWRSGRYKSGMFNWGWMPPHPTFYCRKALFEELGLYRLDYGSAADYELMLRFIHSNKTHVCYLPKVMVKMGIGGISNKSVGNRVQALQFDLKAMHNHDIRLPWVTVLLKPLRKVFQFLSKW